MISNRSLVRVLRSKYLVALTGDLIRVVAVLLAVTVAAAWLTYYAALSYYMFVGLHMNDFGKFYFSSRAFLEGGAMYDSNAATSIPIGPGGSHEFLNMNPPHLHLLILPFATLQPLPAILCWAATNLAALGLSLRMIFRELGIAWTGPTLVRTSAAVLFFSATGAVIVTGQITFLLLLAVTMAWLAARRGRWTTTAVFLGTLTSIKPFFGVFGLFLLITRRFGAVIAMCLAALACVLFGLVVFGSNEYVAWLHTLSAVDWTWAPMNGSIEGLLSRSFALNPMFVPLADFSGWVVPVSRAAGVVTAILSFLAIAQDRSPRATDRVFLTLLLAATLISPLGWLYYLWLPAGPFLALWQADEARTGRMRAVIVIIAAVGLVTPLYITGLGHSYPWTGITTGSVYSWTTLAVWVVVMWDWWTDKRRSASTPPSAGPLPQ